MGFSQSSFTLRLVELLVRVVVFNLGWDLFISVLLTVVMRRHQPYAQWDPQTFQKWKFQWELLIVAPIVRTNASYKSPLSSVSNTSNRELRSRT